ncbi:MAG TPA: 2-oxo-4-hydroxy-4-carboxy-5-ureidoimidazoline decarboxylase [Casimicrobiaceae bacterium]|nr:2-oxo-4-hydroxy-4-carboxy-5-ureidoimidazoline decarboxylase [Casimicrobiaceae bacterium]
MTIPRSGKPTLASLSAADRSAFVAALGGVFEHSAWIAEGAWTARPFASVDALHRAMAAVLERAAEEQKLALIRAHPELAGKEAAAGTMTAESVGEQASAGLDRCSPDELRALRSGNRAYREKFGFPFVMAVKGRSRSEILASLAARVENARQVEFARCLEEVVKIARLRLAALLESS